MILETIFETADGAVMVRDFMPVGGSDSTLVRMVEGISGTVDMELELVVRFDYGRVVPWVTQNEDGTVTAIAGPDMLVLEGPIELHGEDERTVGTFAVSKGETLSFVLTHMQSHHALPRKADVASLFEGTENFWLEFVGRCPDAGEWNPQVRRSLLTLKALTYRPTGGIVAAATTSLPEKIGGQRNWDYRYCWLRDATLTLLAFMDLGYYEEAGAWRDWLLRAIAGAPAQMQIMYGVAGERNLHEWEATWLEGYENSKPVRIGNAAADQFQLDVFGEVADALDQAQRGGIAPHPRGKAIAEAVLPYLQKAWREPDEGIWEVRGERQHFTHSKVMAWVAFDRLAAQSKDAGETELALLWRNIANEIHAEVCAKGFDPEIGSFVQAYGSKALDASLLQIGSVGFLPPDDARFIGTVEAIERNLTVDGLVLRYRTDETDDGLPSDEGAFLACSFWLADALVLINRKEDAERLFRRLLSICNDVGLLAEEYDPGEKRLVGNFPQAFSHVGIIHTALNLIRAEGPIHERSSDHG